jgi:hypothetical protein
MFKSQVSKDLPLGARPQTTTGAAAPLLSRDEHTRSHHTIPKEGKPFMSTTARTFSFMQNQKNPGPAMYFQQNVAENFKKRVIL